MHRGHFELLKYCASLGRVAVGLNSDESVRRIKGNDRPFNSEYDRKFALESCRYVDEVIIFSEDTPEKLIRRIKPDFIVKGGDYKKEEVIGADIAEVLIFNYVPGYSTSSILAKLKK